MNEGLLHMTGDVQQPLFVYRIQQYVTVSASGFLLA